MLYYEEDAETSPFHKEDAEYSTPNVKKTPSIPLMNHMHIQQTPKPHAALCSPVIFPYSPREFSRRAPHAELPLSARATCTTPTLSSMHRCRIDKLENSIANKISSDYCHPTHQRPFVISHSPSQPKQTNPESRFQLLPTKRSSPDAQVPQLKMKKIKEEETGLMGLDENLLYEVLKHVDARTLAMASCVRKQWLKTASDERLWELICTRHWANIGCGTQQLRSAVLPLGGFRRHHSRYLWPLSKLLQLRCGLYQSLLTPSRLLGGKRRDSSLSVSSLYSLYSVLREDEFHEQRQLIIKE
ncbi:F-box protein GID2 [Hibiscus syriacus]|uniref:F-box protein GID2 n=1 Tax=Hibiscus syriacus TaxID=106335 RepID=A0A6A2YYG8_HIBSY|nr:F-box protein GID2 [Hibiscus syriacus]